jgi:hypothetical protein
MQEIEHVKKNWDCKKIKLCKKLWLCKNWMHENSNPREFTIIIPMWEQQSPYFISFKLLNITMMFFLVNKILDSIWRDICCLDFVAPNLKLTFHINSLCVKIPNYGNCTMRWIPYKSCVFMFKYNLDYASHIFLVLGWYKCASIKRKKEKWHTKFDYIISPQHNAKCDEHNKVGLKMSTNLLGTIDCS